MDLYRIVGELVAERARLARIIKSLEEMTEGGSAPPPQRRGRKSMDEAARQQVSERMKRYWAKRRQDATEE